MRLEKETGSSIRYRVSFRSALDTGHPENSTVIGDYYRPKTATAAPFLILTHGMGDFSVIPCTLMARKFVTQGVACFVPRLSIHSNRLPAAMKPSMPYLSPDDWFSVYRTSVVDIRQIVDWAESRQEIATGKQYVLGISFGGFVSAIAMGVDDRIQAGILIVTGGNANKLSRLNKEGKYRKRYMRTEEEHRRVMDNYREYLKRVKELGFENADTDDKSFLTDPLTFAPYLRDRSVLMINAEKDKYIPRECVTDLWEAAGKPEIQWYPSGHVTLWFKYHSIYRTIHSFLSSL